MVDIVITATSVISGARQSTATAFAASTITAGQAIYITAAGLVEKADSNAGTELVRRPIGIALNGGAVGQPIMYQTKGLITIGGTLTAGVAYYLSDTPGGICPVADIGSGEYSCALGIATTTGILNINILYSGVAL